MKFRECFFPIEPRANVEVIYREGNEPIRQFKLTRLDMPELAMIIQIDEKKFGKRIEDSVTQKHSVIAMAITQCFKAMKEEGFQSKKENVTARVNAKKVLPSLSDMGIEILTLEWRVSNIGFVMEELES